MRQKVTQRVTPDYRQIPAAVWTLFSSICPAHLPRNDLEAARGLGVVQAVFWTVRGGWQRKERATSFSQMGLSFARNIMKHTIKHTINSLRQHYVCVAWFLEDCKTLKVIAYLRLIIIIKKLQGAALSRINSIFAILLQNSAVGSKLVTLEEVLKKRLLAKLQALFCTFKSNFWSSCDKCTWLLHHVFHPPTYLPTYFMGALVNITNCEKKSLKKKE